LTNATEKFANTTEADDGDSSNQRVVLLLDLYFLYYLRIITFRKSMVRGLTTRVGDHCRESTAALALTARTMHRRALGAQS